MSHTALKGGKDGLPVPKTSNGPSVPRTQSTSVSRATHPVMGVAHTRVSRSHPERSKRRRK